MPKLDIASIEKSPQVLGKPVPVGVKRLISFPLLQGKLDFDTAGVAAAISQFFATTRPRRGFFSMWSAMIRGLDATSRFEPQQISGQKEREAA